MYATKGKLHKFWNSNFDKENPNDNEIVYYFIEVYILSLYSIYLNIN